MIVTLAATSLAVVCNFALSGWETPFLGGARVEKAGAAFAVHEDVAAEAVVDCFAAAHDGAVMVGFGLVDAVDC